MIVDTHIDALDVIPFVFSEPRPAGTLMEVRRTVIVCILALSVGMLCFWIALSIIDYGFWGVLHKVFP